MDRTEYIHYLQTVWSVILQKSPFPSPQAIKLLGMKNDSCKYGFLLLLHNEKELVLFMKHSDRQTEMEIPE
jgi:hypothetical protein